MAAECDHGLSYTNRHGFGGETTTSTVLSVMGIAVFVVNKAILSTTDGAIPFEDTFNSWDSIKRKKWDVGVIVFVVATILLMLYLEGIHSSVMGFILLGMRPHTANP